jgi:hypothetical protein
MYSVYLDESGHETGDHVVLAGYLGTEEQWVSALLLHREPRFAPNRSDSREATGVQGF